MMATRWPSWTARGVPLPARTNGADAITSTVALTECTPSLTRTVVLASPEPARCCADTGVDKAGGGRGPRPPPEWPGKFFLLKLRDFQASLQLNPVVHVTYFTISIRCPTCILV